MALGPGHAGIRFEARVTLIIVMDVLIISSGFRVTSLSFLKSKAIVGQLLTELRMRYRRIDLLMNFHTPRLKDGARHFRG